MASRISEDAVRKIVATDLTDISEFIATAHLMVDEQLANKGFSDDRLLRIELYLSAHYVTLREWQLKSEKFGDASAQYQGDTGMYLSSSRYGQTAIELDTSGTLKRLGTYATNFELL